MMSDNRVTVATTKQVNLAQLDDELGGHGLNGAEGIVQACEGSPVTEAELAAAILAHVYVDPDAERLAVRESAMAKLAALGLSDVEVAAIVGSV
jgi:hypothetical protein